MPTAQDYVWTAHEAPIVLFRSEADALHVWGNGTELWRPPTSGSFAVTVVFHEVDVLSQARLIETAGAHGLHVVGGAGGWPLAKPPVQPGELR